MDRPKPAHPGGGAQRAPAGFTLVEVLIAMLILAIGMLASLSMQFTALGGATEARDNANASDIAQRINHVMRLEAQQWRSGTLASSLSSDKVITLTNTNWEHSPVLAEVVANSWDWVRVFSAPVDSRLSDAGAIRYCAYVRGGYFKGQASSGILQLQMAVMYPAPNRTFAGGTCPSTDSDQVGALDPSMTAGTDNSGSGGSMSLELQGFRANYFGAQITRRSYLPTR